LTQESSCDPRVKPDWPQKHSGREPTTPQISIGPNLRSISSRLVSACSGVWSGTLAIVNEVQHSNSPATGGKLLKSPAAAIGESAHGCLTPAHGVCCSPPGETAGLLGLLTEQSRSSAQRILCSVLIASKRIV